MEITGGSLFTSIKRMVEIKKEISKRHF